VLSRIAGIAAVVACPFDLATLALGVFAAGASIDVLADPTPLLYLSSTQIDLLRWANLCSLFGYGLLLVPLTVYLYDRLGERSRTLARLAVVCGLAYIGCALTNAVVLWSAWPVLQHAYASADAAQRAVLEAVFGGLTDTVEIGVEAVMYIFGGAWWLLVGGLLGPDRCGLRRLSLALGAVALVAAAALISGSSSIATPALGLAFVLTAVWSAWMGFDVLHRG
jgi:hypothetical protein